MRHHVILAAPHVLGTCWMNAHLSPEIEEQYFQLWNIVYSEWTAQAYGGKGALFLPTALPCTFIFGNAVWGGARWCVFLTEHRSLFILEATAHGWKVGLHFPHVCHWPWTWRLYLLSGSMCLYICLPLSASCLSHLDNRIPQTPTHILPPW